MLKKYTFKSDGFECVASSSEEAKMKHKQFKKGKKVTASFQDKKENFEDDINKVFDAIDHIEDEVDKSVRALDFVKKDSFSKEVVRKYVLEIKKYIEESDLKNLAEMAKYAFYSATQTHSMQEWKEQCLAMLPSDASVADAEKAEKILEEICH